MNNMGKFTFDQSICANSTIDIVATDAAAGDEEQEQKVMEAPVVEEVKEVLAALLEKQEPAVVIEDKEELVAQPEIENPEDSVILVEDSLPDPPPPPPITLSDERNEPNHPSQPHVDEEGEFDDVEMMSIVIDDDALDGPGGGEEDYSNVALPEEGAEDAFPDPPPREEEKEEEEANVSVEGNKTLDSPQIPIATPFEHAVDELMVEADVTLDVLQCSVHSSKMTELLEESCNMDVDDFYDEVSSDGVVNEQKTVNEEEGESSSRPAEERDVNLQSSVKLVEEQNSPPLEESIKEPIEEPLTTADTISPPDILPETTSTSESQSQEPALEDQPLISKAKSMDARRETDEFSKDFKLPTMLRRSLSNQSQAAFGANPFDGASAGGVLDHHKPECEFHSLIVFYSIQYNFPSIPIRRGDLHMIHFGEISTSLHSVNVITRDQLLSRTFPCFSISRWLQIVFPSANRVLTCPLPPWTWSTDRGTCGSRAIDTFSFMC